MSQAQVMQCDVCGKLLPEPDEKKGVHTETLDFCESCKDDVKRLLRDVKNLRALHILIDIVATAMVEEAKAKEEAEEKKKGDNTGTSGFAPSVTH